MFFHQRGDLFGGRHHLGHLHAGGKTKILHRLRGERIHQRHRQDNAVRSHRQGSEVAGGVGGDFREQFRAQFHAGEVRDHRQPQAVRDFLEDLGDLEDPEVGENRLHRLACAALLLGDFPGLFRGEEILFLEEGKKMTGVHVL